MRDVEQMYRQYAIPVKKYVLSLCQNNTLADDITAETFLKAIKNIDRFTDGNILTWLCTIAKNTYFDYLSKKETQNLSLNNDIDSYTPSEYSSPENELIKSAEKLELFKALQKLEGIAKDVMYLRLFADLSFKQIGDILGKSENWARVTFYRSKNKLKGLIENEK